MATLLKLLQNRAIRWIITLAWSTLIFILLVQPEKNPVIYTIEPAPWTLEREIFFTIAHFMAFGITTALWFWAWFGHNRLLKSIALSVVCAMILGAVTEYLQSFAPDRHPSWFDLFTNFIGTFIIAYIIWRKRELVMQLQEWNPTMRGV